MLKLYRNSFKPTREDIDQIPRLRISGNKEILAKSQNCMGRQSSV